jgi:hypothetical protein
MSYTTTNMDRYSDTTLSSSTCTFLSKWFFTTTTNFSSCFCMSSSWSCPYGMAIVWGSVHVGDMPDTNDSLIMECMVFTNTKPPLLEINNRNTGYGGSIVFYNDTFIPNMTLSGDYAVYLKNSGSKPIVINGSKFYLYNLYIASGKTYSKAVLAYSNIVFNSNTLETNPDLPATRFRGLEIYGANTGNIINNTFKDIFVPIYISDSRNLHVSQNLFYTENPTALYIDNIYNSVIKRNVFDGPSVFFYSGYNVKIFSNTIVNSTSRFRDVFTIKSSNKVYYYNNTICCTTSGLEFGPGFPNYNIVVANNTFENISRYALTLTVDDIVQNITITNNTFKNCGTRSSYEMFSVSVRSPNMTTYHIHNNTFIDTLGNL